MHYRKVLVASLLNLVFGFYKDEFLSGVVGWLKVAHNQIDKKVDIMHDLYTNTCEVA